MSAEEIQYFWLTFQLNRWKIAIEILKVSLKIHQKGTQSFLDGVQERCYKKQGHA